MKGYLLRSLGEVLYFLATKRELPLNLDEVQVRLDFICRLFKDAVAFWVRPKKPQHRQQHHGCRDDDQRQLALQNICFGGHGVLRPNDLLCHRCFPMAIMKASRLSRFRVCSRRTKRKWDDYSQTIACRIRNMSAEFKKEIELEIAHVLFIDAVGYSKLSLDDQRTLIDRLNQLVRSTAEFRSAEAAGKLIKIATGDGMALIFYNRPEAPVECALQISRALKEHPELRLRMGVHTGPVSGIIDVNERANVAGTGINMAQRVMD